MKCIKDCEKLSTKINANTLNRQVELKVFVHIYILKPFC